MEPEVPDIGRTLEIVEALSGLGIGSPIRWRYDTVVLTGEMNQQWHLRNFQNLCRLLAPHTKECIFSFCDYYKKTVRNMERFIPDYYRPDASESLQMAEHMAEIAKDYGISLASCAHDFLVSEAITKARAILTREQLKRYGELASVEAMIIKLNSIEMAAGY